MSDELLAVRRKPQLGDAPRVSDVLGFAGRQVKYAQLRFAVFTRDRSKRAAVWRQGVNATEAESQKPPAGGDVPDRESTTGNLLLDGRDRPVCRKREPPGLRIHVVAIAQRAALEQFPGRCVECVNHRPRG